MSGRGRRPRPPKFAVFNPDGDNVKQQPVIGVKPQPVALVKIPPGLSDETEVQIGDDRVKVAARDLEVVRILGEGSYGTVEKVRHTKSDLTFALKKIRCSLDTDEQKRTLREKEVAMRSNTCPYTITFYGALFHEGDLLICMEVMDISLQQLYVNVYKENERIPEPVLVVIIYSVVSALEHLYREINFMHRDVKPSNILADRRGHIKVCDFGISGELVNSLANTNVGSTPYLAPERINPTSAKEGYTILSDVWSLGITVIELACGRFPYRQWTTPFDQLRDVVNGDPPRLPDNAPYSKELHQFISGCVQKDYRQRLRYDALMQLPLLKDANLDVDVAGFVEKFVPPEKE